VVGALEARLSYKQRFSCRRRRRPASCTRPVTRKLTAKRAPGERFVIVASGLRPGFYTLSLVAIDSAGVRQTSPMQVALVLAPASDKKHGNKK
jgi:hypothetical protein